MNLNYCEVCGVLIQGDQGPVLLPEGVICAGCFQSRRASVSGGPRASAGGGAVQFECCYCHSLLRLKPVPKRTRVRCPKCNDAFYLHEDGRIEARLEGSRTAVLQQDDVAPLNKALREGEKTQPIKRSDVLEAGRQHAMLEGLKPKSLDFVDSLPERRGAEIALDTGIYRRAVVEAGARQASPLELAGDDPDSAHDPLRASEEGHVDLGAAELRRKTQQLKPVVAPKPRKKKRISDRGAVVVRKRDEQEPERSAAHEQPTMDSRPAGAEVEPSAERRLPGVLLWLAFLVPLGLGVFMAVSSQRRAPFTSRGRFGQGLNDVGDRVEEGVRSLDALMPAAVRLPLSRPGDAAPVTSR